MIQFSPTDLIAWLQSHFGNVPFSLRSNAYAFSFGAIAGGNVATRTVQMQNNADFVMTGYSFVSENTATGYLQLLDAGSGAPFFASELLTQNVASPYDETSYLPFPRLILGNSAIVATMRASAAAGITGTNVLALHGFDVRTLN